MRPPNQTDDGELERSPLDTRPSRQAPLEHLSAWARARGRRWRVGLAVGAIALAVIAPLVALSPTRAAIARLFPAPTPTATAATNATLSIVNVPNAPTSGIATAQWNALRARPLRLPTLAPGGACPASPGRVVESGFGTASGEGPAYIVGLGTDGAIRATGPTPDARTTRSWGNEFVIFIIAPSYHGPVLVRGRQVDGSHPLLFNGGLDQKDGFDPTTPTLLGQLRLVGDPAYGDPWPNFPAYLRLQAPGCYAIQMDGATFSEVVIFSATFGQ